MTLYSNAVASIELGVEDFRLDDKRRAVSAVRNVYAGVLLLLKEKLRQMSPPGSNEALLYERIEFKRNAKGRVIFVGTGKKTVDVVQIIERFKTLGLSLDARPLEKLQRIRNDIEHHSPKDPHPVVREAIAKTFVLVTRVLEDHLGMKPDEVFSEDVWETMLEEAETFKEIEDRCRRSVEALDHVPDGALPALDRLECPACQSSLLAAVDPGEYVDATFVCRACRAESTLGEAIVPALDAAYAGAAYEAMKGGDEHPIGTCPNCNADAFHVGDDVCLVCGSGRTYENCDRCCARLSLDEQESGMCGWCQHMHDKLMHDD